MNQFNPVEPLNLGFKEMIRKDIDYEQKRSLKMDLYIAWRTLPAVLKLMSDG